MAVPSVNGMMFWTIPFPKVVVPMMVASPSSFSAPVTTSEALAELPFTRTAIGPSYATSELALLTTSLSFLSLVETMVPRR